MNDSLMCSYILLPSVTIAIDRDVVGMGSGSGVACSGDVEKDAFVIVITERRRMDSDE